MMDSVLLLAAGLLMAFVSWAVWSYFGSDTPSIIVTLVLIGVTADNFRLRRRLRAKGKIDSTENRRPARDGLEGR